MKNSPPERIRQIIPATGWSAVFAQREDDGEWKASAQPLVCFALQEDAPGEQTVAGFDGGDFTDNVEHNANFLGHIGPGQDIRDWNDAARGYGEREGRRINARRNA